MATTAPVPARSKSREREPQPRIVPVSPTYWLPDFLDRLASLARLHRVPGLTDPFRDAEVWQRGLLTGIYADTRDVPTVAVAPIDRSPQETVLSTLYGLSAAKQETAKAREVKGVIFVHEDQEEVSRLVHGVPNISTLEFDVHISLRRP